MIPGVVTFVPLFVLVANPGLIDTLPGLILPFLVSPFGVFLMRQFILGLPRDLLDAGRVDGAGELRIFARIFLPLCGPALATLGILTFLGSWNNFLWPLVVAQTETHYTLPVALALYSTGQNSTQYGLLLAGATVVVMPDPRGLPGLPAPVHRRHRHHRHQVTQPVSPASLTAPPGPRRTELHPWPAHRHPPRAASSSSAGATAAAAVGLDRPARVSARRPRRGRRSRPGPARRRPRCGRAPACAAGPPTPGAASWRMTDPKTGLPADNIKESLAAGDRSGYTSPTNIGGYLWSAVVARDLGHHHPGRVHPAPRADPAHAAADGAPRAERHVLQLVRRGDRRRHHDLAGATADRVYPFLSSVDNGWLGAALQVVMDRRPGRRPAGRRSSSTRMRWDMFYDTERHPGEARAG